jgi:hypothetical protein
MTDIYDRARALAIKSLAKRGQGGKGATMVLTKPSTLPPVYNPATGTATPDTPGTYTGSALRTNYSAFDIDGTRIRAGDVKLLVSPVQAGGADLPDPAPGDSILFDSVTYKVINVSLWNYAGLDIGFEVQARA